MDKRYYCSYTKKGNASDVNNYRGITIISVFAKLFSTILNNQLMKWAENCDVLQACQFGFRENCSTIDCTVLPLLKGRTATRHLRPVSLCINVFP